MPIYYVAKHQGETKDPISYLLRQPAARRGGTPNADQLTRFFAEAAAEVYVPVKADEEDAGVVFVAPTVSGQPWHAYFTHAPLKQGAAYGDEGPLTSYEDAERLAEALSKQAHGKFAVFKFIPSADAAPVTKH